MTQNTRSLGGALLAIAFTTLSASAQRKPEPTGSNFKKLVTLDSMSVQFAAISPNGRWLAFAADGSIWVAGTDGRSKPNRLTSAGHRDRFPYWFMSSDALTFTSDRMSRGGANSDYAMTIAIDPKTGRAAGPPRAVSTEPVTLAGYASPDGKWIAYNTSSGDSIKVVPVNGGTARFVSKAPTRVGPVMWRNDGKTLVFGGTGTQPPNWYTVAAAGGTPIQVEHAPFFGDLHLHSTGLTNNTIKRLELRDSTERLVSAIDMPNDMGVRLFNYTMAAAAMISNKTYKTHVYTIGDGQHSLIDAAHYWADGWSPDGRAMVADRVVDGKPYVGLLDGEGHFSKQVALPLDARAEGWEGVVGLATTFRRGSASATANGQPAALYVADVQTGAIRELAARAYDGRVAPGVFIDLSGAAGERQDGDHFLFLVPNGGNIDVERASLEGKVELARSFTLKDSVRNVAVHRSRVAWTKKAGDSLVVFAANGATGTARRVASLFAPKGGIELAWSRRGDQLAMLSSGAQPAITIARINDDGLRVGALSVLRPATRTPWSLRWADDDKVFVMIGYEQKGQIVVVPVNPSEPQRTLTSGEDAEDVLQISPDGKRVMFPEAVTTGTSIWRVDFVPVRADTRP